MTENIRHPEIEVQLTGTDGDAMALVATVGRALRRAGLAGEVDEFRTEALSGDYDNVLATCMRWVSVS